MIITDEMLKLAEAAYDNNIDDLTDACDLDSMRLALEAVAPMLIFNGLMQAVQIASEGRDSGYTIDYIIALILSRAQKLEPK